jgi:hypothetical protein
MNGTCTASKRSEPRRFPVKTILKPLAVAAAMSIAMAA